MSPLNLVKAATFGLMNQRRIPSAAQRLAALLIVLLGSAANAQVVGGAPAGTHSLQPKEAVMQAVEFFQGCTIEPEGDAWMHIYGQCNGHVFSREGLFAIDGKPFTNACSLSYGGFAGNYWEINNCNYDRTEVDFVQFDAATKQPLRMRVRDKAAEAAYALANKDKWAASAAAAQKKLIADTHAREVAAKQLFAGCSVLQEKYEVSIRGTCLGHSFTVAGFPQGTETAGFCSARQSGSIWNVYNCNYDGQLIFEVAFDGRSARQISTATDWLQFTQAAQAQNEELKRELKRIADAPRTAAAARAKYLALAAAAPKTSVALGILLGQPWHGLQDLNNCRANNAGSPSVLPFCVYPDPDFKIPVNEKWHECVRVDSTKFDTSWIISPYGDAQVEGEGLGAVLFGLGFAADKAQQCFVEVYVLPDGTVGKVVMPTSLRFEAVKTLAEQLKTKYGARFQYREQDWMDGRKTGVLEWQLPDVHVTYEEQGETHGGDAFNGGSLEIFTLAWARSIQQEAVKNYKPAL